MDYPLPNKISDYLLCTSILIGLTALITFYNKDYITSILVFSLFLTSINFWRNPQYGIRRTIDMTLCKIICLFFLVSCLYFHEFNRVLYECIVLTLIFFSIIENLLWFFNSHKWVVFHLAIHIYMSYFTIFIYYIL